MENDLSIVTVSDYFGEIEDPRLDRNKKHLLCEVLFIALCTILVGGENFSAMEEFGRAKEKWLKRYLRLAHGVPSHDTFRRVFCLLEPESFNEAFIRWTQHLREASEGEVVAIDGKSLRRTGKTKESIVHVVSAWAATNRLVLGQLKVDGKSNEITAIPELLRMLELEGCIVTLDAMGTQKNIAKEIHEADADYVLALKGNHGTAHDEVKAFMDDAIKLKADHLQYREQVEKDHGRIETRKVWITEEINWFADHNQWENLRSFGTVELTRQTPSGITTERRHFLCSIAADAKNFARAVRSHWGIENSLHWVLDVSLNEDQSRARTRNAAENLALLRKIALNSLRKEPTPKSVPAKQLRAALNEEYLAQVLKIKI